MSILKYHGSQSVKIAPKRFPAIQIKNDNHTNSLARQAKALNFKPISNFNRTVFITRRDR